MALTVYEITDQEDLASLGPVCFDGFENPHNSWWDIAKGPSMEEKMARYWQLHTSTPGSHWIKVMDSSKQILGGAQWIVHEKNPYEVPAPLPEATWWPEGDLRDISNQFLQTFFRERRKRMNRPHIILSICFVAPEARRRGAGKKIMEWGCALADRLRLEAFVEATEMGIPLYAMYGFVSVGHILLSAQKERPSQEWLQLYNRIAPQPFRLEIMWRPCDGVFESGATEVPVEKSGNRDTC